MQPSGQGTDKPTAQEKLQRSIREAKQTIENDNPSGMSKSFKVLMDYKTIRMLPDDDDATLLDILNRFFPCFDTRRGGERLVI